MNTDVSNHPADTVSHLPIEAPLDGTTPDISGKITGHNSKENNYEDQRYTDNWTRNMVDESNAGQWRRGVTR